MASPICRLEKILGHLSQEPSMMRSSLSSSKEFDFQRNTQRFENWARIYGCTPDFFHQPTSIEEIREIINYAKDHDQKIRLIGAAHSPSDIAMTTDHLISLDLYNKVQAGIRLHELAAKLAEHGLAMRNLGSIDEQSIAGAISTGTHGTGAKYGIIASDVIGMKVINGKGEVVECSESNNPELLNALRVSIGALGIIVEITMRVEPLYHLEAIQFPMAFDEILENYQKLNKAAEHMRFMWFPHTKKCVVWQANRVGKKRKPTLTVLKDKAIAARDKIVGYHMLEALLYMATFVPSTIPAINSAYFKILHSRGRKMEGPGHQMFTFDCLFHQYVNEWALPIERTEEVLRSLDRLIQGGKFNIHFPIEVRFVKGDDIWLSPNYGGDRVWIGTVMYRPYGKDADDWARWFEEFERLMISFDGRPHWAKTFSWTTEDLKKSYPKYASFLALRSEMDPDKLFWNDFMERVCGNGSNRVEEVEEAAAGDN